MTPGIRNAAILSIWLTGFLCVSNAVGQSAGNDWPEFRGPFGNGHSTATNLPVEFDDSTNLKWKRRIPGRAWSSPVVIGNQIWMTTAIETGDADDAEAPGTDQPKGQSRSGTKRVDLLAICLNRQSGGIEHLVDLFVIDDPPVIHSLNSYASPTPVTDDDHVYVHFGTFGTAAVARKSGELVWKTQDYPIDHETGPGSSPILHNGMLIFHCDGTDQQYIVALDKQTGEQVWRTDRSGEMHEVGMYKKAFCTPIVVERDSRKELISPAANWIYAYDPTTGEELWKLGYGQLGFSNVARPVIRDRMLYVCSCYMKSKLMAIDVSGDGPVADEDVQWSYARQVPNMSSPIEVDGYMYFTSDRGIATCLDAESGDVAWQERLEGEFSASPVYADGKLFFGNRDGRLYVVRPNPESLEILASNDLDSAIMASPAAVDRSLLVRTEESLYCFGNSE
ncbi:MAG: PQQ-binding-like beta-propeller repeat protein [Pirellulaceae bacterium]